MTDVTYNGRPVHITATGACPHGFYNWNACPDCLRCERDEFAREIARFHATGYVSRADADHLAHEIARLNAALRWANDMLSPENRATLQRMLEGR